jgi:hypothetical protein
VGWQRNRSRKHGPGNAMTTCVAGERNDGHRRSRLPAASGGLRNAVVHHRREKS